MAVAPADTIARLLLQLQHLALLLGCLLLITGCAAAPSGAPTPSPVATPSRPAPTPTPLPAVTPPATPAAPAGTASPAGATGASADPPPCSGANMVYHQALGRVVLVDCYPRGATTTPTRIWGWTGQRWELLAGTGPPGRDLGGAAYDSRRQRLIIYGGLYLGLPDCSRDTWEWDGRNWTQVAAAGPGPCNHFKMTYDAAREAVVLFGGQNEQQQPLAETWTWDGAVWREAAGAATGAAPGPPSRAHFGFVYDPRHAQTWLYGGYTSRVFSDLWTWNGAAWQAVQAAGPGPRSHLGIALTADAGALLIFGGAKTAATYDSLVDETWILAGGAWTQASGAAPAARGLPAMAYDPERKTILLYGGFTKEEDYADTWEWNGRQWTCLAHCF